MRSGSNFTTTVYPIDRDGEEHEINVRIHYDCDYTPAKVSGPPEDCYPADGDMVLTDVDILDDLPSLITEADVTEACEAAEDRIHMEAWDHYCLRGVDDASQ